MNEQEARELRDEVAAWGDGVQRCLNFHLCVRVGQHQETGKYAVIIEEPEEEPEIFTSRAEWGTFLEAQGEKALRERMKLWRLDQTPIAGDTFLISGERSEPPSDDDQPF